MSRQDMLANGELKIGKDERVIRLRRITGYLVSGLHRWNSAKLAELRDRVKHDYTSNCGCHA